MNHLGPTRKKNWQNFLKTYIYIFVEFRKHISTQAIFQFSKILILYDFRYTLLKLSPNFQHSCTQVIFPWVLFTNVNSCHLLLTKLKLWYKLFTPILTIGFSSSTSKRIITRKSRERQLLYIPVGKSGWLVGFLWHINHCRLFNAKFSLYILRMICKHIVCR